MSNIDDVSLFGKSLTDMTSEEIQDRIRENRRLRRTPAKKNVKAASTKATKKKLSGFSKERLLELKALLEEK